MDTSANLGFTKEPDNTKKKKKSQKFPWNSTEWFLKILP